MQFVFLNLFFFIFIICSPAQVDSKEDSNSFAKPTSPIFSEIKRNNWIYINSTQIIVSQVYIPEGSDPDPRDVEYPLRGVLIQVRDGVELIVNETIETLGNIVRVWVTDMDQDLDLEISMWIQSTGSSAAGRLLFYEIHESKLKQRKLPRRPKGLSYRGADIFKVSETTIIRKFAIHKPTDPNCCPTGGRAEFVYKYENDQLVLEKNNIKNNL